VDRLVAAADQRARLADSLELAFREGRDRAIVLAQPASGTAADGRWVAEIRLSQSLACEVCGDVFDRLTPRHFSFNNSEGACPTCGGLGRKLRFAPELVVPDPMKSVREGRSSRGGSEKEPHHKAQCAAEAARRAASLRCRCSLAGASRADPRQHPGRGRGAVVCIQAPQDEEPKAQVFPGVIADLDESFHKTESEGFRARLTTFMVSGECPECHGSRLNSRSSAVTVVAREGEALSFPQFLSLDVGSAHEIAHALVASRARATLSTTWSTGSNSGCISCSKPGSAT